MCDKRLSLETMIRSCLNDLRRENRTSVLLGMVIVMLTWAGGCASEYQQRVKSLTDAYERGDLSREDYLRFVHELESWANLRTK